MFNNTVRMIVQLLFRFNMNTTERYNYAHISGFQSIHSDKSTYSHLKSMDSSTDGIESVNISSSQYIFSVPVSFCNYCVYFVALITA